MKLVSLFSVVFNTFTVINALKCMYFDVSFVLPMATLDLAQVKSAVGTGIKFKESSQCHLNIGLNHGRHFLNFKFR